MIKAYYKETSVTVVEKTDEGKELKELKLIGSLTNKEVKDGLNETQTFVSKEVNDVTLEFDLTKFNALREKGEI